MSLGTAARTELQSLVECPLVRTGHKREQTDAANNDANDDGPHFALRPRPTDARTTQLLP